MPASAPPANSPLDLVVDPPMGRRRVLAVSLAGFSLVVGLLLLAAWLGYRGSDRIQDTAQAMVRADLLRSGQPTTLETRLVAETQELLDELAWILGLCFLLAAGTAAMTVWIIQRAFAGLEWQAAELAHVSWHMIDTHEKLARRFSHEMHDELGQSLSGLRRLLGRVSPEEFPALRAECVSIVDEVIQNVRKLSQVLRPVILDDLGLDSGLRWLCERFSQRTGIPVDYSSTLHFRLAGAHETHLFRITQEALTNIARHAHATQARVQLQTTASALLLTISDNGRGLSESAPASRSSLGMVGMRARARQLGGELMVENQEGGGLALKVEVPLHRGEPDAESEDPNFVG